MKFRPEPICTNRATNFQSKIIPRFVNGRTVNQNKLCLKRIKASTTTLTKLSGLAIRPGNFSIRPLVNLIRLFHIKVCNWNGTAKLWNRFELIRTLFLPLLNLRIDQRRSGDLHLYPASLVIDTYHWKYRTSSLMLGFQNKCTDRLKPSILIKMKSAYHIVQMST